MRWPLRWKLFLSYLAVIAIVIASGLVYLHFGLSAQLMDQTAEALARDARLARRHIVSAAKGQQNFSFRVLADEIGRTLGERVTIIAPDGRVLGDSEVPAEALPRVENHGNRPEVLEARERGAGKSVRFSETVERNMLYLALPVEEGPIAGGTVRLSIGLSQVDQTIAQMRWLLLTAGGFAFLLALAVSLGAAQVAQRALQDIVRAVGAIATGNLTYRIGSSRRDELGELARAMDRLAAEVEARLLELRGQRDQLEAILEGMTEGMMVTDAGGNILLANSALRRFFPSLPRTREELPLEALRESQAQEAVQQALGAPGGRLDREVEALGPPARTLGFHAARFGAGPDPHLVAIFHDLTEVKRLEAVRRDFTANVSHELRTPLTAIRAAAETIRQAASGDPEGVRRFASVVERHVHRLSALVDDLIELGRIESKQEHIRPRQTSLRAAVDSARRVLEPLTQEKRVRLAVDVSPQAEQAWADPAALERVLINLLENAIHFSPPEGEVTVSARDAGNGAVEISVADAGEGIPPEHLSRIFERFYRVDAGRSRERGGTGLGLAIVKHLVDGHGGEVSVESAPGKGSTFRFTLPKA